jgi:hypothetical protein
MYEHGIEVTDRYMKNIAPEKSEPDLFIVGRKLFQ